jgi:hypothetical protein
VCENDTNFWTPTSLQSAIGVTCTSGPFLTVDPYTDWWHGDTNNRPAVIKIYVDGWMRWQGDIDPKTVTYNFKNRTVSFTATGPLKRLATYNAEDLRRDIPRYGYIGKVTAVATVSAGTRTRSPTPARAGRPTALSARCSCGSTMTPTPPVTSSPRAPRPPSPTHPTRRTSRSTTCT